MSNGILYHGFGVRGYEHVRTEFVEGRVNFLIRQARSQLRCAHCGAVDVFSKGRIRRTFRSLPIGGKPTNIVFDVPRVLCRKCFQTRQVKIGFADERRSYTRSFERYALHLSRCMTIQDVARHLGISWDVIKDIQKRDLGRRFARPKLRHLTEIAIDEIHVGRGHQYLTIVLDLRSGAVVFVGKGKGAEALDPFWKRLHAAHAQVRAVAIDMSLAYQLAVRRNLPNAVVVFDHFHIIKLFNDKLADLRRELYREATEKLHKDVLKGTRWLLLKNPENLDPQKKEPSRLKQALQLNETLATAYYLKEDLRQLWDQPNKTSATAFLNRWITDAETSGVRMLQQFAKTLATHRSGILAYYDYPISTGPLEGTNNKIKTMQRQAYGFRDHEFLTLKIYALHEAKYALVG